MCGLAGTFTSQPASEEELRETASRMAGALAHRGPDDEGVWADAEGGVALGFRRLSIVDLSPAGRQPMRSSSGRYVLVFNGEVYNDSALREELRGLGLGFRGHSDTEVVLAAFEAWGIRRALGRFVGMFAMALWDTRERTLTLLRDRMGIKPLFVHQRDGVVLFGSELKALMAVPGFERKVSRDALRTFLRYLYVPAPESIFEDTWKLLPGTLLTLRDPSADLPEPERWWSLDEVAREGRDNRFAGDEVEAVDRLEELLATAVDDRMRSDVPVGALLSGGIDSSTVTSLMRARAGEPLRTYTIGFGGGVHDESARAARIAACLGTRHTCLDLRGDDALTILPELPDLYDEPLADPSQIPTCIVSRLARSEVTVALSGDGGDELFAGYNRYVAGAPLVEKLGRIPAGARRRLGRGIAAIPPAWWDHTSSALAPILPERLNVRLPGVKMHKLGVMMGAEGASEMYRSLMSVWHDPGRFVVDDGMPAIAATDPYGGPDGGCAMERMALADQGVYLPDDLLAKVDRASMAVGLELRVPILDHRVVEFSWSLPPSLKIREGRGKWILNQVLRRHLPRELVDGPKIGFSVPLDRWLRGPLRSWSEEMLDPETLARDGLLEPGAVQAAWRAFIGGRSENAPGIWALLSFQSWRRRWLG
ncbi:MAG: asparagine synthase (glutamine-hydrolyzing) [Longimicrobiales bacterium]|nr:asparagine synthase (glutamine-hydrolyzing) [Longimicrobiales bacterium]